MSWIKDMKKMNLGLDNWIGSFLLGPTDSFVEWHEHTNATPDVSMYASEINFLKITMKY